MSRLIDLFEAVAKKSRWEGVAASYHTWRGMKDRMNPKNKDNKYYANRGIGMHPDWVNYNNFLTDVGEPPVKGMTLDRIDNNKGYEPGNVRWATKLEQTRNRSNTRKK